MRWTVLVVAMLPGCAADPTEACRAFVEAYTACLSEAWADDPASLDALLAPYDARYCEGADGLTGKDARRGRDQWTCLAEQYDAADCSGHNIAVNEALCAPPAEDTGRSSTR